MEFSKKLCKTKQNPSLGY